jgi:hypothetical protein
VRLEFTVVSHSATLLNLVRDFAKGLGWTLGPDAPSAVSLIEPSEPGHDQLLNLLTSVSLSAAKAGVDPGEPICRVRYRQGPGSEVTLGLRIAEFDLKP